MELNMYLQLYSDRQIQNKHQQYERRKARRTRRKRKKHKIETIKQTIEHEDHQQRNTRCIIDGNQAYGNVYNKDRIMKHRQNLSVPQSILNKSMTRRKYVLHDYVAEQERNRFERFRFRFQQQQQLLSPKSCAKVSLICIQSENIRSFS